MAMSRYCKLIMVTPDNNNKFYEMVWDGNSSNFNVKYGRVESTSTALSYSMNLWDRKYNEKVKKGYKDVTELVASTTVVKKEKKTEWEKIENAKVAKFMELMTMYTNGLVDKTYSVKSDNVTQKQVDEAQRILDGLAKLAKATKLDVTNINSKLIELYMVIPRYIKDVRVEIVPHINLKKTLSQEQANLDAMSSQVMMNKTTKVAKQKKKKESILDNLGITMTEITSSKEIDHLVKQISGKKVKSIFEVNKKAEKDKLSTWLGKQSDKTTCFAFHGTKNTSVIPILQQGLRIRPAGNFHFSGKAYGNGNYFSGQYSISSGYMEYSNDQVLLIYEVHVGKVSTTSYNNYNDCVKAGYDSYASEKKDLPRMRVAYNEEQTCIKYIIWL